jgi:hypothetical protein
LGRVWNKKMFGSLKSTVGRTRGNWRNLEAGMNEEQVRTILGEPVKEIQGVRTLWYYPSIYSGYVSFDDKGRLSGWKEP